VRVTFVTDEWCVPALTEGLRACGLEVQVPVMTLPGKARLWQVFLRTGWEPFLPLFRLTHLIALERVGPSHTEQSVQRQLAGGGRVACRVATEHLLVTGVSNWGGYALAAGLWHLKGGPPPADLFDVERERQLLQIMVDRGSLIDGVTGQPTATVDGLPFERYV